MPSDGRIEAVVNAVAPAREAFQSAVTQASEELRTYIESHRAPKNGRGPSIEAELGVFAAGRIDPDRFAALLGEADLLDEASVTLLERARSVLQEVARAGDAPFRIDVLPGGALVPEVETALSLSGRAFGAARVAELVRTGRSAIAARDDATAAFPFARWTRAERSIAPPLVVEVDGGDLQVAGLAAFLDGTHKVALIVREPAPPASLARLITPGVFVMQTQDVEDFEQFAAFAGPGIAALVPDGCALFVHDPSKPAEERLVVKAKPGTEPRRAVGRVSAFQQAEELHHLGLLADAFAGRSRAPAVAQAGPAAAVDGTAPAVAAHSAGAPAAAEPVDKLAAWLLAQANLPGQG